MTVVISMTIDIIFNEKEEGTKKRGNFFCSFYFFKINTNTRHTQAGNTQTAYHSLTH